MNTRVVSKDRKIIGILSDKTGWHLSRVEFLALFLQALIKCQTVCFTRLATVLNADTKPDSNLRRIQRFFAGFDLLETDISKILVSLLPVLSPYRLSLDRTNWKFGKTDINILMLSVCYYGVAIPLMWKMLPKAGNSNQDEREELISRFVKIFGTDSIESILADREFIGSHWMRSLKKKKIPFYIRIKENMWINTGKGRIKAFCLFRNLKSNSFLSVGKAFKIGGNKVYLTGMKTINKKNQIEYVIVASSLRDDQSLTVYKDRWQIETMFKAFKTSGFNLEDTHLTDIKRISKLLAIVSIAFVWAYNTGIRRNAINPIPIKKHGRKQFSYFSYGLRFMERALVCGIVLDLEYIVNLLSCT